MHLKYVCVTQRSMGDKMFSQWQRYFLFLSLRYFLEWNVDSIFPFNLITGSVSYCDELLARGKNKWPISMYSHLSDNIREQQKLDKTIKIVSDVYLPWLLTPMRVNRFFSHTCNSLWQTEMKKMCKFFLIIPQSTV